MQINGESGNYKISNPILSKNHKASPSFRGHTQTKDERGRDVLKVYLPNAGSDVKVQFSILEKTSDGQFLVSSIPSVTKNLGDDGQLSLSLDSVLPMDKNGKHPANMAVGYKFLLGGQHPYFDFVKKAAKNGDVYNVATPHYRPGHSLPRQMAHIFPDSYVLDLSDEKRNHFNHLGGSLNSILAKVPELKEFGIRKILGTPIFGQDTVSSHGYWTNNGYQITNTVGDLNDFQTLQKELFKNGMGWVADGAFVNEGLQGVHVKDILDWGVESPFINWFDTTNIKDYGVKIGVLSKQKTTEEHTRFKLINAPYKIEFEAVREPASKEETAKGVDVDKDGNVIVGYKEKNVVKNKSYDPQKPTFIQLFDERLVTAEQVNKDEIFEVYGKKNASDRHQIYNYMDSVEPYSFRVSPKDVEKNYNTYKEVKKLDNDVQFKDKLHSWSNFEIVKSNNAGGLTTWVGNTDIPKRRFMISEHSYLGKTDAEIKEMEASKYQVQDDTIQIGKFWTNEVARTIVTYTAEELAKKYDELGDYKEAVKTLIEENKLPKTAEAVLEGKEGDTALDNILKFNETGKRNYILKPTNMPENITEGLMSYPLDAIEFSPDLSSVLAYPYLRSYAVSEDTLGKSRYELFSDGKEKYWDKKTFYDKMPEKYQKVYKKMDTFIAGSKDSKSNSMTDYTIELLKDVGKKAGYDIVNSDGTLTEDGKDFYSLVAPDIAKFIYVSSINPDIKPEYKNNNFGYNTKELQKTTIESLGLQLETTPEGAAQKLLGIMKDGISHIPSENRTKFVEYLANQKAVNMDSNTVNVARLIAEKTESGLDWRIDAAKDVGDWDGVDSGTVNKEDCLKEIAQFWTYFNKGVRAVNPMSYTIGELTDLAGDFEDTFTNRTGFSAESNYTYMFSAPFQLFGVELGDDGKLDHQPDISAKITNMLTNGANGGYLGSQILDSVNFSHVFIGNHDKPRVLHLLATNLILHKDDKAKAKVDVFKRAFEHSSDFKETMAPYQDLIKDLVYDNSGNPSSFANGKYLYKGEMREYDAENFGALPFDININDIFDQAQQRDNNFKEFAETNPEKVDFVKAKLLETILSPAMTKYTSIAFFQVGMPGTPTIYAGDELGETGWETSSKNNTQDNRNRLHIERLKDPNYKFVQDYYNNLKNIMNVRNQKGASPLVNGSTIPLTAQKMDGEDSGSAAVLYRYNDKTDNICVFHNDGYSADPESRGVDRSINSIKLERIDNGLPYALKPSTRYYNALNPDEKFETKVENNVARIEKVGGGPIGLGNRGIILIREYGFDGTHYLEDKGGKTSPSFHGRQGNPHVQLANMKYKIG